MRSPDAGEARQDQDRRLHLGDAQRAQNLVAGHVRKVQVEEDDVVIVQLAEIDALFAEVRRVDIEALRLEHQLDALRRGAVVFNEKYAHLNPPQRPRGQPAGTTSRSARIIHLDEIRSARYAAMVNKS
jgi:translation initiation factor IF-1